jgi:hypothetical protein
VRGISFPIVSQHLLALMHQAWWAAVSSIIPVARGVAAVSCECPT